MTDHLGQQRHGVVYGPSGKSLDVHRAVGASSAAAPTVLLWHGKSPDERDVLAPLAAATAALGMTVMVPDWRPDDPDGGLAQLRESIVFVRERAAEFGGDAERVILAGWSRGAFLAAAVVLRPELVDGWQPAALVGIAGRYTASDPALGIPAPVDDVEAGVSDRASFPGPVELIHGTGDEVVGPQESRAFHAALVRQGRPVTLTETETDHAGVVMTEYSPQQDRCLPARGASAQRAGGATADVLARAAGLASHH